MTQEQLLELHAKMCDEARATMAKKNNDYADPQDGDVFGNIDACEKFGICSAEQGIIIRMLDKIHRLVTSTNRPLEVIDESASDTRRDLINYLVLMEARGIEREAARTRTVNAPKDPPRDLASGGNTHYLTGL